MDAGPTGLVAGTVIAVALAHTGRGPERPEREWFRRRLVAVEPSAAGSASADVVSAIVDVFDIYFSGVNLGTPRSAYAAFSAHQQAKNPYVGWAENVADSRNENVTILGLGDSVDDVGTGPVTAQVSFRSHQPGDKGVKQGETCTDWSLTYTLIPDAGGTGYLIDRAKPTSGGGHSTC